ncbi:MAG TPA: hypothetical protein VMT88_11845 [Actinomycetes bacterium]|nr:hypothetical protein [Actinomycetes bacterium]
MAKYRVNRAGVTNAKALIASRRYVVRSRWSDVQPSANGENDYLETHSWSEYGSWHLAINDKAGEESKGRFAFGFGDFRRIHRSAIIACYFRAAEWDHKEVELAAHRLLQALDQQRQR